MTKSCQFIISLHGIWAHIPNYEDFGRQVLIWGKLRRIAIQLIGAVYSVLFAVAASLQKPAFLPSRPDAAAIYGYFARLLAHSAPCKPSLMLQLSLNDDILFEAINGGNFGKLL